MPVIDVEQSLVIRTVKDSVDAPFPFRVTAPEFVVDQLKSTNILAVIDRLNWKPSSISYFKNSQKYLTVSLQHHTPQDIHRIYTLLRSHSNMVLRNWKD